MPDCADMTYRPIPAGPGLIAAVLIAVWGATAYLVITRTGAGAFLAIGAALGTWLFGTRTAHTVEITADGQLAWRALLRQGRCSLAHVAEIRPARWDRSFIVVGPAAGAPFAIPSGRGLAAFLEQVRAERPDLARHLGPWIAALESLDRTRQERTP